jgi:hypothetical protein
VGARDDQHQRVTDQVVVGQDAVAGGGQAATPVVHDGHVDLARADLAQAHLPGRLPQQQGQAGVGPQPVGQHRGERDRRGRERADHDPAGRILGLGRDIGLGLFDQGQDALGVVREPPAGVGQLGPPRGPVQQRRPGLAFQRGQLLGHGRRGVTEGGRGGGDAAPSGELLQQAQAMQVEHKKTLRSATEIGACSNGYQQQSWLTVT